MAATADTQKTNTGRIEEIQGVVIEAVFPDELPEIYSAITVATRAGETLVLEVQQHLGDDRVRAVAMDSTDGLARGMEVVDTGGPITVPVGDVTLGRIFNLLGEPDRRGRRPRHQGALADPSPAPTVEELTPTTEMFETGIKVVDLLAPTRRAARSACSAAPAWARPCSSRSSSTTWPRSTAACPPSAAWASAPARATTSGSR